MRSQELKHCSGSLQEHVFDSKLEANTCNSGTTDALSPLGELLPADEHATSENILKDIAISSLRLTPHADHYCHVRHPLINKCSDIDVVAGMWIKMSNQGSVDCRQIGRQRIRHDLPQKEPNSVREERVRGGESC